MTLEGPIGTELLDGVELRATTLTPAEFERVSTLMRRRCGIEIHDGKEMLVYSRLAPRVTELGMATFAEYLDYVHRDGNELARLVDLLTTNKTGFFREMPHFRYLDDHVLPAIDDSRPHRIWSAGCSSGEEPYSLAMLWAERAPSGAVPPVILATDISTRALAAARAARYSVDSIDGVDHHNLAAHFEPDPDSAEHVRVRSSRRSPVSFARLNLMDSWPMRGPFDLILCRNVMIYFSRETQLHLSRRFAALLRIDGLLFTGHSESLSGTTAPLEFVQPAVYRRIQSAVEPFVAGTGDSEQ